MNRAHFFPRRSVARRARAAGLLGGFVFARALFAAPEVAPEKAALPPSVIELRAVVASFETTFGPATFTSRQTAGQIDFERRYEWAVETLPIREDPMNPRTGYAPRATSYPGNITDFKGVARYAKLPLPPAGIALDLPALNDRAALDEAGPNRSRGVFDHFADEPFLEPLELRLRGADLGGRLLGDLESYLIEREALANEIAALAVRSPGDGAAMAALAVRQQARLAALETQGDELRARLAKGNLVTGDRYNALARREWRIDDSDLKRPRELFRDREALMLRQAAYFAEGFSPAQRRLLREASFELVQAELERRFPAAFASATPADGTPKPPPGAAIGLLPEQSRLRLPADLPDPLRMELAAIGDLNRTLRQELRDAVFFNDRHSEATRRDVFARLAASQEARIGELERRIDAVRPQLAALPGLSVVPSLSLLPDELQRRIDRYRSSKSALQTELQRQLADAAVRRGGSPRVLRLHTVESSLQAAQILESLTIFEGRHAAQLDAIETDGAGAEAKDRELVRELRRVLVPQLPKDEAAAARFRFSCDTAATSEAQRQAAREQFAGAWERRRDVTAPLEQEAVRLHRLVTASDDSAGIVRLLADLQKHWLAVEQAGRALSFELGLARPPEAAEEWQRRRAATTERVAREQRARLDALEAEERAIRTELARLPGASRVAGQSFDTLLNENRERMRSAESWLATGTYRTAVLAPGLSPAQRRLLLGAAVVELRRWQAPAAAGEDGRP